MAQAQELDFAFDLGAFDGGDAVSDGADEAAPAEPAPAEPVPAEPAPADGEFGIKDCDTYMQRVAVCDPYEKHPDIGKLIIDKWKRLKAEGNLADLEKLCSRALMLYECQAK